MFTIRATQKLLRRIPWDASATHETATTVLGDWYANLVVARPSHLVVAVSESTMLPVIVTAKNTSQLPQRISEAAREVLLALDVPPEQVEAEYSRMQRYGFAKTNSRRILGGLNDFVFQLGHYMAAMPDASLLEHSLALAGTPTSVVEGHFPDAAAKAAFAAAALLGKVKNAV
jgi:hypothetical protein